MKQRSKKEVGDMFKKIRLSKGLSLEQLADMTDENLTVEQIDLYEKGEDSLPLIGFILMCKALEVEDPDAILYEEICKNNCQSAVIFAYIPLFYQSFPDLNNVLFYNCPHMPHLHLRQGG